MRHFSAIIIIKIGSGFLISYLAAARSILVHLWSDGLSLLQC